MVEWNSEKRTVGWCCRVSGRCRGVKHKVGPGLRVSVFQLLILQQGGQEE